MTRLQALEDAAAPRLASQTRVRAVDILDLEWDDEPEGFADGEAPTKPYAERMKASR